VSLSLETTKNTKVIFRVFRVFRGSVFFEG
jgi:hypothetical protein